MASAMLVVAALLTVVPQAKRPTRALVSGRDWLMNMARAGEPWNNEAAAARLGQPIVESGSTPGSRMRLYFHYPSIETTVEVDFDTMHVVSVD